MNQAVKNVLIDLITPTCLLLLGLALQPLLVGIEFAQTEYFSFLPLLLLLISALLSWKFHQLDAFYLSIMLGMSYGAMLGLNLSADLAGSNNTDFHLLVVASAVFIPLNFLIFRVFPLATLASWGGILRLLLLSFEAYIVFWSIQNQSPVLGELLSWQIISEPAFQATHLPQLGIVLLGVAILIQIGLIIARQKPLDSTLLGILVAITLAIYLADKDFAFFSMYSAAAIMMSLATIQASYNMAFVDTLTGLPNRRALDAELKKLGKRYCIAMLDIDHFKKLNDEYGHDVGDQVLRMVAKHIRRVRGGGRPARYGGEEFAIVFPNRTIIDASPFLEIVRESIAQAHFALRDKDRPKELPKTRVKRQKPSNQITVTLSIGLAERTRLHKSPEDVIKLADDALYKAKKQGRNQLVVLK